MIQNRFPLFFARRNESSDSNHHCLKFTTALFLSFILLSGVTASPQKDKYYLRIGYGKSHDTDDLSVGSLGVVSLKNNMIGHVDLSYMDSDVNGSALALDFGAGLAYSWYVSPYISIGASLGYNWDNDETIAAYFPEVGILAEITKAFGVSLSARRYYSLYEDDENVIMLGLVFKK
jgi:hypothetical protein